jgi:hypothetical protein
MARRKQTRSQAPTVDEAELEHRYHRLVCPVTDPPEPGEWLAAEMRAERDRLDEESGPLADRVAVLWEFRKQAAERCSLIFKSRTGGRK